MKFSINHLQRFGFDEARLTVELILAHTLQCQRIELYTNFEKPLSQDELNLYRRYFERRLAHEPVQYIVGSTSFMGIAFDVDKRVFIPRPETETLIEQAILFCNKSEGEREIRVLEIGTGSGNIAVSVAKFIRTANVTTIDINPDALDVARTNALRHAVEKKIAFIKRSVFDQIEKEFGERFDLLISNPPYVPQKDWEALNPEVREFEPRAAVSDQGDGLSFYRRIAELPRSLLRDGGCVMVEVGDEQSDVVRSIFMSEHISDCRVIRDLQERERVVSGVWTGS
jgi:release factor glutamine methyltransferase